MDESLGVLLPLGQALHHPIQLGQVLVDAVPHQVVNEQATTPHPWVWVQGTVRDCSVLHIISCGDNGCIGGDFCRSQNGVSTPVCFRRLALRKRQVWWGSGSLLIVEHNVGHLVLGHHHANLLLHHFNLFLVS